MRARAALALCTLAAVAGCAVSSHPGARSTGTAATSAPAAPAFGSAAVASVTAARPVVTAQPAASARPPAAPSRPPVARADLTTSPAAKAPTTSHATGPRTGSRPAPPVSGPPASVASSDSISDALFSAINSERRRHGVAALRWSAPIAASARAHCAAMDRANTVEHQEPGEPDTGHRMLAAGYRWSVYGENLGMTQDRTRSGALAVQDEMDSERSPNDPHRAILMSSSFTDVGIAVLVDQSTGLLLITEDFGKPL